MMVIELEEIYKYERFRFINQELSLQLEYSILDKEEESSRT